MVVHMFSLSIDMDNTAQIAFDTQKNIIHVMELEPKGDSTLQSAFCSIQPCILDRIRSFGSECKSVRWFIYDAEGNVKECKDGHFHCLDLTHSDAHPTFVQKCKVRQLYHAL